MGRTKTKTKKTLRVRRPLSSADRADIEQAIRSDVARYKQLEERKKAFTKLCADQMKAARARIEAGAEAIDKGFGDQDVEAVREGDDWVDNATGEVIDPSSIVPSGATDDKQLDLFEEEDALTALAMDEAIVEARAGDEIVIRLKPKGRVAKMDALLDRLLDAAGGGVSARAVKPSEEVH